MDEKQNIDTPNGFSKKIGRTHFLVNAEEPQRAMGKD